VATLDDLKAQRDRLSREYEAIQAEFSTGKNFKSGKAEEEREAREMAKYRELRQVNEQIRLQEGKVSAAGQTADSKVDNTTPKEIPGEGTIAPAAAAVTDAEAKKIKNNERNSRTS